MPKCRGRLIGGCVFIMTAQSGPMTSDDLTSATLQPRTTAVGMIRKAWLRGRQCRAAAGTRHWYSLEEEVVSL